MKKQRKKGSGRKTGDGVLKNIDSAGSGLEKRLQLAYGRTHDNHIAKAMRWFRNWPSMIADCEKSGDAARRGYIDSITKDFVDRLTQEMVNALWESKPDWFQSMADTMILVQAAGDEEPYPIHHALLDLAGVPSVQSGDTVVPERVNFAAAFRDQPARYTIAEICDILEKSGKIKSALLDDANAWSVTVRRACDQIGFPYRKGKPGPKHKQS